MSSTKPLISIIIATYNSEKYLQGALNSIKFQTYQNFEVIVVDGASKDGTMEIVNNNKGLVTKSLSEKDKGIYDAWNKGLNLVAGEWVMFVGSDDALQPDALEIYVDFINKNSQEPIEFISGKMMLVDHDDKQIRVSGEPWKWPKFSYIMTACHTGSLTSVDLFKKYGNFNDTYKIVGDYEFLLRPKADLKAFYINNIFIKMREGGVSRGYKVFKEHKRAMIESGGRSNAVASFYFMVFQSKMFIKSIFKKMNMNVYLRRAYK